MTTSSRAGRLAAAVAVPVVGTLLLGGCTGSSAPKHTPVPGPTVGLATAAAVPGPLSIGVVVSSTSAEDEGAQDLPLAAGARVAQYRLNLGHPVDLVVQDDHGTAEGATAAVQALLDKHVAGIVYASEGEHLAPGLQLAAAAHTAVLLPYADQLPTTADSSSARLSGPTRAQTVDRLTSSLRTRGLQRPLVITTTDVPGLDGVAAATGGVHRLAEGGTLGQQAVDLAKAAGTGQPPADSVVVWGSGSPRRRSSPPCSAPARPCPSCSGPARSPRRSPAASSSSTRPAAVRPPAPSSPPASPPPTPRTARR